MKKYLARVMAGVAFLNVAKPNWLKKINTKELDLSQDNTCVIGEVYGSYTHGISKLELTDEEASALGFQISDDVIFGSDTEGDSYDNLTKIWRRVLRGMGAK